ncbi:MAG: prepilin peptidase [Firmicutes bacterium]|nr:prepilin peptidase [Bacillota bacterium]
MKGVLNIEFLDYSFYLFAGIIVTVGCYYDIRTETIPNWCPVPVFLLGILKHFIHDGGIGILYALMGGICFLAFYLAIISRFLEKLGMGDCKLLFAIGTFAGVNNLGVLLPVQLFITGIALLGYIAIEEKLFNPVAYVKHLIFQFKMEKYEGGKKLVFGPFIGIPFIIYLITVPILIEVVHIV